MFEHQKKKQRTTYVSTKTFNDLHIEEILQEEEVFFVVYDINTGKYTIEEEIECNGVNYKPLSVKPTLKNALILPDGVEEYGTLEKLRVEMLDFALEEFDPVDNFELFELDINLFLTSWISPEWQKGMAEKFIPIINPRGPSETGKKRFLTIARWLSYHSLYGLKTNRVPTLFRGIAPINGTLSFKLMCTLRSNHIFSTSDRSDNACTESLILPIGICVANAD